MRSASTLLGALVFVAATAQADRYPRWSVDTMCGRAELILEGRRTTVDDVRIKHIHKASPRLKKGARAIEIAELSRHDRALWHLTLRPEEAPVLPARDVILFLEYDEQRKEWRSLSTIVGGPRGTGGSSGVVWTVGSDCYAYDQPTNPGPYVLQPPGKAHGIPATLEGLRTEIRTGVRNAGLWRAALATEDPAQRARALARFLLNRTSPVTKPSTYRHHVREPMGKLGRHAVPELVRLLATARPEDDLSAAVLVLYDIGPDAGAAVPELCKILGSQRRAESYAISALRAIGDRSAVPKLREVLRGDNFSRAVDAAQALAALEDRQSLNTMLALLPKQLDPESTSPVLRLLEAVQALDAARSRQLARDFAKTRGLQDYQRRHLLEIANSKGD
ncbi:MAG: hypothetical protein ACE10D_07970 [Planctomycetota bacterium]|nr:hypothetical protein [Planctomycetota bacterium]